MRDDGYNAGFEPARPGRKHSSYVAKQSQTRDQRDQRESQYQDSHGSYGPITPTNPRQQYVNTSPYAEQQPTSDMRRISTNHNEKRHRSSPPSPNRPHMMTSPISRVSTASSVRRNDEVAPPWNATTTLDKRASVSVHAIASGGPLIVNSPPRIPPRLPPPRPRESVTNKGPRASTASSGSLVNTSPSKSVLEVARLKAAREERRAKQAERKRELQDLNPDERENREYMNSIKSFRDEFDAQINALGDRIRNSDSNSDRIRVCMRARPVNHRESQDHQFNIVTARTTSFPFSHCYIHEPRQRVDQTKEVVHHRFIFDDVFDDTASNADVYNAAVRPLVESVFRGGKATLFAYGQTSSGKTHTIFGNDKEPGVYDYATRDLFKILKSKRGASDTFVLEAQFFEIYGGRVFDLFAKKARVELLEDAKGNARLVGLSSIPTGTPDELRRLVAAGSLERTTGATDANEQSSRSHAVLQLSILRESENGKGMVPVGHLALVDLAGSERGADTAGKDVPKQRRVEAAEINKSLLALKECIRALHRKNAAHDEDRHVPFRASKLTQVLRDSFIGPQSQTVMIAAVAPSNASVEHTLNTLRYADRVKEFRGTEGSRGFGGGEEVQRPGLDTYIQEDMDDDVSPDGSRELRDSSTSQNGLHPLVEGYEGAQDLARPPLRPSSTSTTASNSPRQQKKAIPQPKSSSQTPKLPKIEPPSATSHFRSLSALLEEEDALHRLHKSSLAQLRDLDETEARLLAEAARPDHDVDSYLEGIEKMLRRRKTVWDVLNEKVSLFRKHIDEAENS
ncbi:hypothetical protein SmJEL517_g01796 [Synchytrium microbalum]|uniref:Kinesin-like protein n=1 Tax=Synchytrium microbalum TaxID=1806994 RepID=A0A507CDK7_9FUNG|nr:uncharacterized protein SmJEL517_g01796 [Synchytrium microbalum]TPX36004.1 hypothetical protein SmJEL517_g01796 [Synchytrium microbalum]